MVDAYCQGFAPGRVRSPGHKTITVASSLGTFRLPRQVLTHAGSGAHIMPGDVALPAHGGIITTRALQEWACLLVQDLPFATTARLLGWQPRLIREAELEAKAAPAHRAGSSDAPVSLVPHATPCRRGGRKARGCTGAGRRATRWRRCAPGCSTANGRNTGSPRLLWDGLVLQPHPPLLRVRDFS